MEHEAILLIVLLVGLPLAFLFTRVGVANWNEQIARVALKHGLGVDRGGERHSASGRIEAGFLSIAQKEEGNQSFTEVSVYVKGLPHDLVLSAEGLGATFEKLLSGEDLEVGDPDFDRKVVVRGGLHTVLPLLDAVTRARLGDLVADGSLGVSKGTIELWSRNGAALDDLIATVSEIAGAMARHSGEPPTAQLLAMVEADPSPGVRRGCGALADMAGFRGGQRGHGAWALRPGPRTSDDGRRPFVLRSGASGACGRRPRWSRSSDGPSSRTSRIGGSARRSEVGAGDSGSVTSDVWESSRGRFKAVSGDGAIAAIVVAESSVQQCRSRRSFGGGCSSPAPRK